MDFPFSWISHFRGFSVFNFADAGQSGVLMFASEIFADKPFSEVHIPGYLYFMLHRYGLVQGSFLLQIC